MDPLGFDFAIWESQVFTRKSAESIKNQKQKTLLSNLNGETNITGFYDDF
jgi:hypothetical protein